MIPLALFWAGCAATAFLGGSSLLQKGDDKRGGVALPFALFLGAAVARYLGY